MTAIAAHQVVAIAAIGSQKTDNYIHAKLSCAKFWTIKAYPASTAVAKFSGTVPLAALVLPSSEFIYLLET